MRLEITLRDGVRRFACYEQGNLNAVVVNIFPDASCAGVHYEEGQQHTLGAKDALQLFDDMMRGFWGFSERVNH